MVINIGRKLEDDIDALFRLPVAEFTSARNALAAELKKKGRQNDADRVKLLGKPSISAWAVNQLYWDHRDAFDQFIATANTILTQLLARCARLRRKSCPARV